MAVQLHVRETPVTSALHTGSDAAHPDASGEPVLELDQIQGNTLPGFLKDFQTFLFLQITDPDACQQWLRALIPFIATADQVLAFNRLFKNQRSRRGVEAHMVKATWVNIAFSANGLQQLGVDTDAFVDNAFKEGLAAHSEALGDPTDLDAEGAAENWLVGGPENEADIILLVASDDRDDLFDQVQALEDSIFAFRIGGMPAPSGVQIIFKQNGANLPGSLAGHEQFGFLDGVSQPGIRGRASSDPSDVITPRQNPRDPGQGKPGQDLLWPGEFVFGYVYQDPQKPVDQHSDDTTETQTPDGRPVHLGRLADAGPHWARNGSFLVFRRLRQDVAGLHTFLHEQEATLSADAELLGAKFVGRWQTGAPILRAPHSDKATLGQDDCANNDFEFFKKDPSLQTPPGAPPPDTVPAPASGDGQCAGPAEFPASPGDRTGGTCPFGAHIRKAYPRDDITPAGTGATDDELSDTSEQDTQTHRLLRRGIPYGPASRSTIDAPLSDDVDRGLLFFAYQTSIDNQFEFVIQQWVNDPDFKQDGVGFDPILGQNGAEGDNRRRPFTFQSLNGTQRSVTLPQDWVIPTGGGYFFSPSLHALQHILTM